MSCASAGLALPANSASVSESDHRLASPEWTVQPASLMAGVEGFEPPNGGIKTRCLTTWRHPNGLTLRAAGQLVQQRRRVQPARDERAPRDPEPAPRRAPRPPRARISRTRRSPVPVSRAGACRASQSSASATAGKRARTTASQSFRPPVSKKPRIVVGGEFRVNSGAWNTAAVGTLTPGKMTRNQDSAGRLDRREPFAHALRPGGASLPRKRAHRRPTWRQLPRSRSNQADLPDLVQRQQRRGRIRAAAAQAAAHRNALPDGDFRARAGCRSPLAAPGPPGRPGLRLPARRPGPWAGVITPSVARPRFRCDRTGR